MDRLVRTDKNGTKIYASCRCRRCGGSGYVPFLVDSGRCWNCGGTGSVGEYTYKVMTPEYAEKLEARRLAKKQKEAPARNAKFFEKEGFDKNGTAWVVVGNTYEIKDELKNAGAKFNYTIGWHFDHEVSDYRYVTVSINEIAEQTATGDWWYGNATDAKNLIKDRIAKTFPTEESKQSNHIGTIGDKVEVKVIFTGSHTYETHFTYRGETMHIYKFKDIDGNVIVWRSSASLDLEENNRYTLKGTIKEHSEYRNVKQTIVTRCKVAA